MIETPRLALRRPDLGDYPVFEGFWSSERAAFVGGPMDTARCWTQFAADMGHWVYRGFGLWTVTDRSRATVLGWVGLFHPPHYEAPELGWLLTKSAEGKGIAHEAATAVLSHGRKTLGMGRIVSYIAEGNDRSVALAKRLGATGARTSNKTTGEVFWCFEHPAPEARP